MYSFLHCRRLVTRFVRNNISNASKYSTYNKSNISRFQDTTGEACDALLLYIKLVLNTFDIVFELAQNAE